MYNKLLLTVVVFLFSSVYAGCQTDFEIDKLETKNGDLELWCIGHGTIMIKLNDLVIHIDPVSREADYSALPDADLILVTHSHGDHLDPRAISEIWKASTKIICNSASLPMIKNTGVSSMKNGEIILVELINNNIKIESVPAYNIKHERSPGVPFHKKGDGNGYIINIADKRIYVAGDTENIPEMCNIKNIDVAFLPMNLPYTMSPEMTAKAALSFKPLILYPYHKGSSDTNKLVELLRDSGIDVRIRNF